MKHKTEEYKIIERVSKEVGISFEEGKQIFSRLGLFIYTKLSEEVDDDNIKLSNYKTIFIPHFCKLVPNIARLNRLIKLQKENEKH